MRVESKSHLVESIEFSWNQIVELLDITKPKGYETRIRLKKSIRRESIKDVLAHLHGWHKLFLSWYNSDAKAPAELPAAGFKWNQTPQLNQEIFEEWKEVPFASVKRRLIRSHNRIMAITNHLSDDQIMEPGSFAWTGNLSIGKYIASATTSHYKWASAKIKKISSALKAI